MNPGRSESLIHEAVEILDQADDIETRIRAGEAVTISTTGEVLRGEGALTRLDAIRQSVALPLQVSAAINLERIANALEAIVRADQDVTVGTLDPVPDSELIAELARRHHPDGLPS